MLIEIEDYMLPCLNKKLLGFECMGCGLQRSTLLLAQGEFSSAFYMYPAIYSLAALFGFVIFNFIKPVKHSHKIIIALAIINVIAIVGSYLIKITL